MSATPAPPAKRNWWKWLLVASLALNFLVGGAVAARFFMPERVERMIGLSTATQLLPRRFFGDLPRERRRQILDVLKVHRDAFRIGRTEMREAALNLAAALEAEPYDAAATDAAIAGFTTLGSDAAAKGAAAAKEVLALLTPGERKLLAGRLKERDTRRRRD